MEHLLTIDSAIALLTLTAMEIVLGIDNIVFIAILVAKLPLQLQAKARNIGLSLALVFRLGLLFSINWIMGLTEPLITVFGKSFSGRDFILISGGLFLLAKATREIHLKIEGEPPEGSPKVKNISSMKMALFQIILLDIVFSLDSVITAVGMAREVIIMVIAMVIAVGVMLASAGMISRFVEHNPTVKMLALSFLILIGVMLLVEGMGGHIEKGYIYFAMAFSLIVEMLNMRYRKKHSPS